jgi:heptosyltransferase-1
MESILIVKTSSIGDVIQTFPILDYLRARFPAARIDWAAERGCAPLLRAHPFLDRVWELDSKTWRRRPFDRATHRASVAFAQQLRASFYDVVFDLQGNAKSGVITLLSRAREKVGYALRSLPEKINWLTTRRHIPVSENAEIRTAYLQLVQRYFRDEEPFIPRPVALRLSPAEEETLSSLLLAVRAPAVMVACGSKWRNKRLAPATLTAFLQGMHARWRPYFLFIYADREEQAQAQALHALFPESSQCIGSLTLPLWQALMARMNAVIAMDSAALHLCATTSTPSFSVFGPSSSARYCPPGGRHHAFQGACPYGRVFVKRCPKLRTCSTGACMQKICPDELLWAFAHSPCGENLPLLSS